MDDLAKRIDVAKIYSNSFTHIVELLQTRLPHTMAGNVGKFGKSSMILLTEPSKALLIIIAFCLFTKLACQKFCKSKLAKTKIIRWYLSLSSW